MNLRILLLIAVGTFFVTGAMAQTETLTFDDLPSPGTSFATIPTGYGGLQWSSFLNYFNPATNEQFPLANVGVVSMPNCAIITNPFTSITSTRPFNFNSFYVTSATTAPLELDITGLNGSTTLYTQTIDFSGATPELFTLNFKGITEIDFDAFNFTALDNLNVSFGPVFSSIPGLTPNQHAVASNLDLNVAASGTHLNKLITALQNLPIMSLPGAFDRLTPLEFGQLAGTTAVNNASFETEAQDNYDAGRRSGPKGTFIGGNGGIDASGLTINDPSYDPALAMVHSRLLAWNPAPSAGTLSDLPSPMLAGIEMKDPKAMKSTATDAYSNPWNFYVRGNVILAQGFSDSDVAHFDDNTASVTLGTDYRITPNFLVGLTAGYGHTDATLDTDGSSATVDSYSPGLYASYADKGWYANLSGNYIHNAYTQSRVINFLSETANSAPEGNQGVANLDGGYEFHQGALTFGPLAGVQYTHLTVDGYHETGSAADLSVSSQNVDSIRSRLGGRVSYAYSHGGITFTPHFDASWQHECLDQNRGITSQFNGGLGSFSVQTANPSRDSALVDAGLDAEINHTVTVFGDYTVQAGQDNYLGQSVQAGVKIGF